MFNRVRSPAPVLALVCSISLSALLGCGAFERWACGEPCSARDTPADGVPEDFTLGGQDDPTATVSEPFVCDTVGELETFAATVVTPGSDVEVDAGMWKADRLIPELDARGLWVGQQLADCGLSGETALALVTTDWALLDAIARTIIETAEEDDVGVEVLLVVEPHRGACPDIACGA